MNYSYFIQVGIIPMSEESIVFDQSSEGVYSCILHLLIANPNDKFGVLRDTLNRMNPVVFKNAKESFEFYRSFLIELLQQDNYELSQDDSGENKRAMLDNYKAIKELEKIEK